jgi:hypothetical protein
VISPLISLRKDQDLKSDGNCGYYAIISQIMPKDFGGNILGPGKDISEYAKKIIYEIRGSVLQYYNKINENNYHNDCFYLDLYNIEENDWLQLNEIQPIADYCGKYL